MQQSYGIEAQPNPHNIPAPREEAEEQLIGSCPPFSRKKVFFDMPGGYTYNTRETEVLYAEEINHNSG
jgi:hypothetical protein